MRTPASFVLVNGLSITLEASEMFQGTVEALRAQGFEAHRTVVQGDGTLEALSQRLWAQLEKLPKPLALLCHSMGGLQARTFLVDPRKAEQIAAVVTVGSPHEGTCLARLVRPFGEAYRELTPRARAAWQAENGAQEAENIARFGVLCGSAVAGTAHPRALRFRLLTGPLLRCMAGRNDGLVTEASQRYGEHILDTELDHRECAGLAGTAAEQALWVQLAEWVRTRSAREAA